MRVRGRTRNGGSEKRIAATVTRGPGRRTGDDAEDGDDLDDANEIAPGPAPEPIDYREPDIAAPVGLCVSMAAAEIVVSAEAEGERARIGRHRDSFVEVMRGNRHPVVINEPMGNLRHPGNASLRFDGLAAQDILGALQPWVAASTGAACTSGIPEPSHVLRALGLSAEQADSSIRFSFGRFTTGEEVCDVARIVRETVENIMKTVVQPMSAEERDTLTRNIQRGE